jgi:hypothetical protein
MAGTLHVGTEVADRDGHIGTISKVTEWRGSLWYDVRFASGESVRYPRDLTPLSPERYADYVAYFTASSPDQEPMAYEHWRESKIKQARE